MGRARLSDAAPINSGHVLPPPRTSDRVLMPSNLTGAWYVPYHSEERTVGRDKHGPEPSSIVPFDSIRFMQRTGQGARN